MRSRQTQRILAPVLALTFACGYVQAEFGVKSPQEAAQSDPISYDIQSASWLFDPERIIAKNDVVYNGPATADWHSMPVGGGDLWALVRGDGGLHLRLYKADYLRGSLGNVDMDFGQRGNELVAKGFTQQLDLYHGKVRIHLGGNTDGPSITVWGHPSRPVLVIEISDPGELLGPARVTYSAPHEALAPSLSGSTISAWEVDTTTDASRLKNTGMQDYFTADDDPMIGRGAALVLGAPSLTPTDGSGDATTASMTLSGEGLANYQLVIAGVVTEKTDPLEEAVRQYDAVGAVPMATLTAEHADWWRQYWAKSFLCLESLDQQGDWLAAAYHVQLYTLGCLNRGRYPHRYDGGGPLLDWVQEVRFVFSPLYAANRLEMARSLPDAFSRMQPYMEAQTEKVWGVDGLWVPECYTPWGHTNDIVLEDDGRDATWLWHRRDPAKFPYGKFDVYNNHTGLIFTSGLEISHHFLTYYHYSGDEAFLREQAYPFIKGACAFIANVLQKEADGRYHLDPANALETWWEVRDPADTFDAIRYIFPEFIRLSEAYDLDAALRTQCEEVLAHLPEPSIGKWYDDGRVDPDIDAYAPATGKHNFKNRINAENPALYRVYPFGLSGIGSPDYDRARRTFEYRTSPLWFGWAMDAIWAARLGLSDEACTLLVEHARRFNVYPFGGWDYSAHTSHDKSFPPNRGQYTKPFLDAGGSSATALNEILLQSHHGLIRVVPALSEKWSGIFQLRAEGGFLVSADVHRGYPRFAEIRSLLGKRCRIANPWKDACIIRTADGIVLESTADELAFDTVVSGVYVLERASHPVAEYPTAPLEARERFWRQRGYRHSGLPGRD